ncbi:MAG: glycosyltransferase [Clostridia bacterium]|nr:glycosyltransferase [Clostridia bacterium]
MISQPLISIVVPVYKVEAFLSRCIDSILNQTFKDFELILVDDGSPDNCGNICDEYAKKDSRIIVMHQENKGVSVARNNAIEWTLKNSDSQWIAFVDSDDWLHPQYIELLYSAANNPEIDISACQYEDASTISPFTKINKFSPQVISTEEFYIKNPITAIAPWCKLYRKTYFETIRYPVGIRYEDEFTTYKVLFKTNNIAYTDEKLYFYYTNPDGFMNSDWSPKKLDAIKAYEDQIVYFHKNKHTAVLLSIERKLLWYIIAQIEITENSDKYAHITKELKKKLKRCLKDFKKDLNLSIKNDWFFYKKAYPKRIKLYCFFISVLKKMKIKRS